ncbi:MAG: type II secretion system F family protein [Candidatus Marinimicrobia bacterium]|nr:type II secretion system F family protein [Candidatus Neomarinimicrobiota bacterium]
MKKFNYRAKDKEDKTVKGVVEAQDPKQAARILQEKGLLVIAITPFRKSLATQAGPIISRITTTDLVNFTRQLSTMVTAGLQLTSALEILENQSRPAMMKVVTEIRREIEAGSTLAKAMEAHPQVFDQVYVALIRAGEAAGSLDKVLARLADNLESKREFQRKITGALIYPAIVILGMGGVGAIMVLFVIPKMMTIYEEFQAELPLTTKILLSISGFITNYWYLAIVLLAGLIFGFRILSKNPQFKTQLDKILFRLPIIGQLKKVTTLTEFTRTLSMLVGSGVLIVDALKITTESFSSPLYRQTMEEATRKVERGIPLATAMAQEDIFPPILPQMIAVGEETGKIDEVLNKVSVYFEQEAETAVKGLTTAMEPIIMIVLGIGVGFLIISVIMPIYNLTSQF